MAETLRLELAPFHVKVLSVVTGALKTNIQAHFDDWKLPEGSLYGPVEPTIRDRARGQEGAPRMEADDYAQRVVADIIGGRTGKVWHGASAGAVKFGTSYLPTSLMVCDQPILGILRITLRGGKDKQNPNREKWKKKKKNG